jgi:16S rRNA (cytosine1402-N4)-methyltransferase
LLAASELSGADVVFADLGVSSMQLDEPARGFSLKAEGPLDMRMNPTRGESAAAFLQRTAPRALAALLEDNSDEPHAARLAELLAGKTFADRDRDVGRRSEGEGGR